MTHHPLPSRIAGFTAQTRILPVAAVLLGASLLAGCAGLGAQQDSLNAQSAADKGNWPLELSLAQRAYQEDPDVINEFNVATGYQQTGQFAKATALYLDVVATGKSTEMNADRADARGPIAAVDANISDEAARRIAMMAGRPSGVVENLAMTPD